MNTYSSYKDSGIEWMGNIPESWELTKNRFGFLKHKNGLNESDDTNVLSLTTTGVKVKRDLNFGKSSESYIGHQLVEQGDIVFTPRDFDQTPILSDVSKYEGCISNLYIVDKTKENVLNRYVNYYWYGLKYSVDYFKNFSHGMRYSFNRFQFDEIPLLIPSLREQQQISDYLDYKTSKIDILIEKTQQKIELLKEQRTSLINTTVTKGLDPNVGMKDSGIEWIGEIPSGWSVKRLKYTSKILPSNVDKHIFPEEIQVRLCNYTDVYYNELIDENTQLTKGSCNQNEYNKLWLREGDVIITKDSETSDDIGIPTEVKENLTDVVCGYHLTLIRPLDVVGSYIFRFIQSDRIRRYFEINSDGVTRFGLGKPTIQNMYLPIPPLQEQQQISDYLDKETSKIDKLVDIESKRIILLKEYRQSLISDVVTGKVDVRDEVLG